MGERILHVKSQLDFYLNSLSYGGREGREKVKNKDESIYRKDVEEEEKKEKSTLKEEIRNHCPHCEINEKKNFCNKSAGMDKHFWFFYSIELF